MVLWWWLSLIGSPTIHITPRHDSTIGAAFVTKDLLADGVLIKLEMWVREPSRA
jgi:hypothetical protein